MTAAPALRRGRRILVASLGLLAGAVLLAGRIIPGLTRFAANTWLVAAGLLIAALVTTLLVGRANPR